MKRNIAVSLFCSVAGVGLVLILLSAAGSASAQSAEARSGALHPNDVSAATPLTSTFTYQGQLKNGGTAVNGSCQMVFRLYDDPAAGSLIGNPIAATVPVSNGLFTVGLNFGSSAFNGNGRWLDIQVDCGGGLVSLTPRQSLTAAPFASYALSSGALQGYPVTTTAPSSGQVLKWNGSAWAPDVDNTGGGGSGWSLTGNAGTNPLTNFLGTTDAQALVLKTNNIERIRVGANGNVGIGTITPTTPLHVVGSLANAGVARFDNGNPAGFAGVYFDQNAVLRGWVGYVNSNSVFGAPGTMQVGGASDVVFSANPAGFFVERMRISATTGNVGIGTTSPSNKLSVNGGADFSNGTVGIGTTTPFTTSVFNPPSLQVVANSPKTTVANTRALAVTTNDASNPFALDIRLNGAAVLANRSAYIQTTDFNLNDGGNILLQPSIGNVGIGISSPSNKLSVNGTADFSGNVGIGITNPVDAKLVIQTPTGTNGFSITDGNVKLMSKIDPSQAEFGTFSNHDLLLVSGGFGSEIIDAAAGNLFPTCDGCSSLGKLTNRWTAVFAQNGTIQTSDARLKKSVVNLDYGLTQVMQLRPVTFQWKDSRDARTHLGLIAQEVDRVVPEVVEHSDDPAAPLGLNYSGLVPVLIKAVQEQQTTITKNDAEIKKLQAENESLNARLTALEQRMTAGDSASHAESSSSTAPWFLFGGMMVFGLIMVQKRRTGGY